MPNPGRELSSIDFASMLGRPLVAMINAQAQAAISTVNFIKEVCLALTVYWFRQELPGVVESHGS
jgi:hypothetical protein